MPKDILKQNAELRHGRSFGQQVFWDLGIRVLATRNLQLVFQVLRGDHLVLRFLEPFLRDAIVCQAHVPNWELVAGTLLKPSIKAVPDGQVEIDDDSTMAGPEVRPVKGSLNHAPPPTAADLLELACTSNMQHCVGRCLRVHVFNLRHVGRQELLCCLCASLLAELRLLEEARLAIIVQPSEQAPIVTQRPCVFAVKLGGELQHHGRVHVDGYAVEALQARVLGQVQLSLPVAELGREVDAEGSILVPVEKNPETLGLAALRLVLHPADG